MRTDASRLVRSKLITDKAEAQLKASSYSILRHVSCEAKEGVVTLRGQLPSFFHKQLAQEALAQIDGITQVVNQIEVASY